MDVADEVQDEFQGLVAGCEREGGVEEEGGLLGEALEVFSCFLFGGCCGMWFGGCGSMVKAVYG